ncbi:hypothetical protein Goklo_026543 [Gossypium klotzschianum]|uniref:Uncharacterized protein n=1 Tax=Gossypium klotzschianum TaxID=34286 RepID=A0A7J8TVI7_9ROSI|nr:hypothetical protein [Gossypium klotzschianum]
MVEEFALIEGDVVMKVIKGILSITFFDRVKGYIERRMARTVIVKMLGEELGTLHMASSLCRLKEALDIESEDKHSSPTSRMVAERRKGRGRFIGTVRYGGSDGVNGGLRFTELEKDEGNKQVASMDAIDGADFER